MECFPKGPGVGIAGHLSIVKEEEKGGGGELSLFFGGDRHGMIFSHQIEMNVRREKCTIGKNRGMSTVSLSLGSRVMRQQTGKGEKKGKIMAIRSSQGGNEEGREEGKKTIWGHLKKKNQPRGARGGLFIRIESGQPANEKGGEEKLGISN